MSLLTALVPPLLYCTVLKYDTNATFHRVTVFRSQRNSEMGPVGNDPTIRSINFLPSAGSLIP